MTDVAEGYLTGLGERGFDPVLAKTSGALAVRLIDGPDVDEWMLTVDNGTLVAERGAGRADATLTVGRPLFERMVQGRANAMAAVLRGEARIDGDLELLMSIQRIFPGPDDARAGHGASST
jgi:alkyl sulfatase BDS1-like metallo-beta-lactamase superfamily hydrolase